MIGFPTMGALLVMMALKAYRVDKMEESAKLWFASIAVVGILALTHTILWWDEAVYMGMGKYLFSSGNIGFWEIVRPIGLPLILGLIWKSGLNYLFFSEFMVILFSIGNIILTYMIGKKAVNKKVGFIASLMLAITSVFFLYTNYILTEIPSTFFILFGDSTMSSFMIQTGQRWSTPLRP